MFVSKYVVPVLSEPVLNFWKPQAQYKKMAEKIEKKIMYIMQIHT